MDPGKRPRIEKNRKKPVHDIPRTPPQRKKKKKENPVYGAQFGGSVFSKGEHPPQKKKKTKT